MARGSGSLTTPRRPVAHDRDSGICVPMCLTNVLYAGGGSSSRSSSVVDGLHAEGGKRALAACLVVAVIAGVGLGSSSCWRANSSFLGEGGRVPAEKRRILCVGCVGACVFSPRSGRRERSNV